jgi:hypothetical protein
MITLMKQGNYELSESAHTTKLLTLDTTSFAWINAKDIGEILAKTARKPDAASRLALGTYRIYKVKDEPEFTDLPHLELSVGSGLWQGYLLPTGLPNGAKKRSRIIPSKEIITN